MTSTNQNLGQEHEEVVLYDIPTKEPRSCSSQNVWKTRATLNFKGIPYRTEWLEYPEIASTLKSFGIKGNKPGTAYTEYWCPAVRMPDGTYIMHSHEIAIALESLYPKPPLYVSSPNTEKAQAIIDKIILNIAPKYLHRLPDDNFSPVSKEYYHRERARVFGMSLYEAPEVEMWAGEKPWENSKELFQDLNNMLEDTRGPFVMGNTVSYADFVFGALWEFFRIVDHDGDVLGRALKIHPAFERHETAIKPWYERSTY